MNSKGKAVKTYLPGDDPQHQRIMIDILGNNYKQTLFEQELAYAKYLRMGTDWLEERERKLLKMQVFPIKSIMHMLSQGKTVKSIKDTMIEAQGTLGGFAVPPNRQENIIMRAPGLTAVRGGGARVITLVNGNSTELSVYGGGDDRYVGNLRGQWGTETQAPGEQNATMALVTVMADVYTYKIPMSASLLEDAGNLVDMVEDDIVSTVAIDEDEVFLVGDGVGKPLGWVPGGQNTLGINEVNSGNASALTTVGIKALKRGLASQYRRFGVWVGKSDTYSDIENLTVSGTGSDFAFPDLSEEETLLKRTTYESEAMPDVDTDTFPLLFAWMNGYTIVEVPGMTIMRMQDSLTGINKVELHVRKRVGGRPTELYKAAVQKVAA